MNGIRLFMNVSLAHRSLLWTTLRAGALVLVLTALACTGSSGTGGSQPTDGQRKNAESCESLQAALKAINCQTTYTTVRCSIYEGVSGDCVAFFQCMKDAACDNAAQRKCDDVRGSCGKPS